MLTASFSAAFADSPGFLKLSSALVRAADNKPIEVVYASIQEDWMEQEEASREEG